MKQPMYVCVFVCYWAPVLHTLIQGLMDGRCHHWAQLAPVWALLENEYLILCVDLENRTLVVFALVESQPIYENVTEHGRKPSILLVWILLLTVWDLITSQLQAMLLAYKRKCSNGKTPRAQTLQYLQQTGCIKREKQHLQLLIVNKH